MAYGETQDFARVILEHLRTSGVQQAHKEDRIAFFSITPWPGDLVCAEGRYVEGGDDASAEKRAAIFIGPEFGTVARPDLVAAAREAADVGFDVLIACAFQLRGPRVGVQEARSRSHPQGPHERRPPHGRRPEEHRQGEPVRHLSESRTSTSSRSRETVAKASSSRSGSTVSTSSTPTPARSAATVQTASPEALLDLATGGSPTRPMVYTTKSLGPELRTRVHQSDRTVDSRPSLSAAEHADPFAHAGS